MYEYDTFQTDSRFLQSEINKRASDGYKVITVVGHPPNPLTPQEQEHPKDVPMYRKMPYYMVIMERQRS